MKLNNHIGIHFIESDSFRTRMMDNHFKSREILDPNDEASKSHMEGTKKLFVTGDTKTFLIQKSASEIIDKIKTPGKFDFDIEDQDVMLLFSYEHAIRYTVVDGVCRVMSIKETKETGMVNWVIASINFKEGFVYISDDDQETKYMLVDYLIRTLIFLQFSELEEVEVIPNTSNKASKSSGNKVMNNSSTKVITVNSKWNTVLIPSGTSNVVGHFRLQPCGKGRKEVKLTYVKGHLRTRNKVIRNTFKTKKF